MRTNRTKIGVKRRCGKMVSRDVRVTFKLSEDRKLELEQFANDYGVTMSALCALIIGQWLYQQEKVQKPLVQAITTALEQQMKELLHSMDPDAMKKMLDNVQK